LTLKFEKASQVSNSEVLSQLQNLKKHLHNEQMQVENELNNAVILFSKN